MTPAGASVRRAAHRVPFIGHEIAEYVIALALLGSGLHLGGRLEYELIATGGALLLLGIISDGPLGAIALLSRRLHQIGDLVIAAGLALSPFIFADGRGLAAIVLAELLAAGLVWMTRATRYLDLPRAERRPRVLDVTRRPASSVGAAAGVAGLSPTAARAARQGARRLGLVAGVTKRVARTYRAERSAGRSR